MQAAVRIHPLASLFIPGRHSIIHLPHQNWLDPYCKFSYSQHKIPQMTEEDAAAGFAVYPKLDCPHLDQLEANKLQQFFTDKTSESFPLFECHECHDRGQNWICMRCHTIACSRYVKGHMAEHNSTEHHPITLSFSDASFWCYECQSYVDSPILKLVRLEISQRKHSQAAAAKVNKEEDLQTKKLTEQLQKLELQHTPHPTLDQILKGIKEKTYQKIVVLTGAGISVAAGIPDFRTPGTGLYSKLEKYNLPYPEAIFTLDYYRKNPQVFITLAKEIFNGSFKPTLAHHFIAKLDKHGVLLKNLTQNIDDLEIEAGLREEKLLQAHGHSRSAHCIDCHKEVPIAKWKETLEKEEVLRCACNGLIKPDIIFFGQALPKKFQEAPELMDKADLVFIMGTSLKVMPFAFLAQMIPKKVPIVLLNFDDCLTQRFNKIWMKGSIEDNVKIILKELEWE